ncbi:dihydroorotase [Neisseria sp. Ec49-e6-T10]|uniref:dihydroorotase n=1 Tax=Neisseria sp. Ec49-e6-T10 TaxID=3140744 RepID=UPI003EB958C1
MEKIEIIQPDDMHLHLRDGAALVSVLPYSAKQVARAVIMPNLKPPVVCVADALAYKQRILNARPQGSSFEPLMTLYLTDKTTPAMVAEAKHAGVVAFKLYPAGATTNSDSGVTDLFKLMPVLEKMVQEDMSLLVHGEVTDESVDIFDREAVFIDQILQPLIKHLPELRIVFEHITTEQAAQFVASSSSQIAATVTPQHLLFNRNDMLVGGIKPHFYCLPVLKRAKHQFALLKAVTGDYAARFFMGTDSAPHAQHAKENACGCAGVFSAHAAVEFYAQAFEQMGALDKLEAFTSVNGAQFYKLPINRSKITLIRNKQQIAQRIQFADDWLIPMNAGQMCDWCVN